MLGYGFSLFTQQVNIGPRVTGIGGILFKAKDPAALKAWYSKNLGLQWVNTGLTLNGTRARTALKRLYLMGSL
ncbi:hypothetical protein [Mucilaginibacter sp. SJ]|uniref:hypothetical protein n=1 Tax=Mucilaginibacter sp. SJ TaxID=3029053 RepID=UPI0023A91759|nr:hypothetical protein [Mucilaginibacter sp. SJ]WEA01199.1 hypothetical protein MusilaSJ_27480 [Mucilaginibacter sp. SJ]